MRINESIDFEELELVMGRLDSALNEINYIMQKLEYIEDTGKNPNSNEILTRMSMVIDDIQQAQELYSNI